MTPKGLAPGSSRRPRSTSCPGANEEQAQQTARCRSRDHMISRQQEVETLSGTAPRGTKQITASKGPMSSEFHTEVWVGLWNVSPACPPLLPLTPSLSPPCQPETLPSIFLLLLFCSNPPLSGMFSLSFLQSPHPVSLCHPPPPPSNPAPQGLPGLQEPVSGRFFVHARCLVFGSSCYTLVLCPCFVHSRCFTFVRRLSRPSLLVDQGSLRRIPPAGCWGWD